MLKITEYHLTANNLDGSYHHSLGKLSVSVAYTDGVKGSTTYQYTNVLFCTQLTHEQFKWALNCARNSLNKNEVIEVTERTFE